MSETIAAADARANFSEILAQAFYQGQLFVVKKSRKPMAVIIGINEFKAMQQLAKASAGPQSAPKVASTGATSSTHVQEAPKKPLNKAISVSY